MSTNHQQPCGRGTAGLTDISRCFGVGEHSGNENWRGTERGVVIEEEGEQTATVAEQGVCERVCERERKCVFEVPKKVHNTA